MSKPLKIGILGYSLNAVEQKLELEKNKLLEGLTKFIVGFDPDENAQGRLGKLESVKVAKSFEDFLDTSELQAVLINSPPQYHAEQAIAALESGLHVFSEIPMALKSEDLERVVSAEEDSGKIYQLGENYCFIPEILYAGHLSSSNLIGEPVYAEAEYLHDVTYRWREGAKGDVDTPRVDSWYQLFDPLMYAHSIGPAQVALGGLDNPMPFIEVVSYANDLGGYQGKPICAPAKAFQVALFRTETSAIAKCANAYKFAREPTRISIQIIGNTGAYECNQIGFPGRQYITDGHLITRSRHRKGKRSKIDKDFLSELIPHVDGDHFGADVRVLHDWLISIQNNKKPSIPAKIGANFCMAGIAASKSARSGGKPMEIKIYTD
ncbi:MAG: Gfo/Idh/MocA family protein [Candidatus Hermodarchaeota archaeon]